ncbi:MAG: FmdB family transcriptional regulator [Chloroflexota bacterium]|nr:FmdB family transcriptional regulator [Chloroflexota bacterium]
MPTYTYRCADCGNQFDAVQRFSDDPLRECPSCGGGVRRVIQPVGVVFKGSGWYITDSRQGQDNGAKAAKPDKEKADAGEKSADKTDGKKGADEAKPAAAAASTTAEKATVGAASTAKPTAD